GAGWAICSAPRCCSCSPAASTGSTPTWWRSVRARTGRISRASPSCSSPWGWSPAKSCSTSPSSKCSRSSPWRSAMSRITIDPVTRIEGHLRIDAEIDGGVVRKAWSSGQMFRGIEKILEGRDPREAWLFTQRFCGVCTTVHAIASVRAVEDALKLEIPANAQYIRNLILINHGLHDHIVHFYHLSALDWVDVLQIPKADPGKTSSLAESLSPWVRNSRNEMKAAQDKVKAVAESGQLGIFANGYWGHPAMHLPPEVNLLAFSHYLQALEFQRKANQVVGMLGGKTPHIQNLTVGGVS